MKRHQTTAYHAKFMVTPLTAVKWFFYLLLITTTVAAQEQEVEELTVIVEGKGTVTMPAGIGGSPIECRGTCSEKYQLGDDIILTANPSANSRFEEWKGDYCSLEGRFDQAIEVLMARDKTCTAVFTEVVNLTINKAGTGKGRVVGSEDNEGIKLDCGDKCNSTYDLGTPVTLSARPESDSTFEGWTGSPNCSSAFNITTDMNCAVTFNLLEGIKFITPKNGAEGIHWDIPVMFDWEFQKELIDSFGFTLYETVGNGTIRQGDIPVNECNWDYPVPVETGGSNFISSRCQPSGGVLKKNQWYRWQLRSYKGGREITIRNSAAWFKTGDSQFLDEELQQANIQPTSGTYSRGEDMTVSWNASATHYSDNVKIYIRRDSSVLPWNTLSILLADTPNDEQEVVTLPINSFPADNWRVYIVHEDTRIPALGKITIVKEGQ